MPSPKPTPEPVSPAPASSTEQKFCVVDTNNDPNL